MDNSLEIQREYFELALHVNPHDETIRFALSAVLKDMGEDREANRMYAEGIDHLNHVWLSKIFLFIVIPVVAAAIIWLVGVKSVAVLAFVVLLGPFLWVWIRRNRHRWMPEVGFSHRENSVQDTNMVKKVERIKQMLKENE